MVEGQLYWRLLEKNGLYNARQVMADVAREMVYFSGATNDVPEHGVDLKANQLAGV